MDPVAAIAEIVTAIPAGNFDTAQELLNEVRTWAHRGGYLPQDPAMIAAAPQD